MQGRSSVGTYAAVFGVVAMAVAVAACGAVRPTADRTSTVAVVLQSPVASAASPTPTAASALASPPPPSVVSSPPARSVASDSGADAVRYPDGNGGTRVVRWPAAGSGRPWTVSDPSVVMGQDAGDPTPGARDLLAALAARTGYRPDGAGLLGRVDGAATGYRAAVSTARPDPTRPVLIEVAATRGGLTARPVMFDYCGTWPAGRPGLGADLDPSTAFEFAGPLTCSVVERQDGLVVVHLRVDQGERHGSGDPEPAPLQLWSFTVRPDGTAVRASAIAAPDAGWDAAAVAGTFRALDDLVAGLPYPRRD